MNLAGLNVLVHVARFAADEGFIDFDFPTKFPAVLALMREPHAVKHEPRRFLGDAERPANLVTANSVLSVRDEPNARKPFIQTKRGIFKDRSDLNRELALRMPSAALPTELILEKANFGTATSRTYNTVGPLGTARNEIVQAILGDRKEQNCFLEGLRILLNGFHESILRWNRGLVKYIFALERRVRVLEDARLTFRTQAHALAWILTGTGTAIVTLVEIALRFFWK